MVVQYHILLYIWVITESRSLCMFLIFNLESHCNIYKMDQICVYVCMYDGIIHQYDRNIPGMLATCAIDKTVKLWDTSKDGNPICCGTKDMDVGKLYTCSFYMSSPWLMGCGGAGGKIALWDLEHEKVISERFSSRQSSTQQEQEQSMEAQSVDLEAIRIANNNNDNNNKEDVKEDSTSTKSKKKKKKKPNSKKKKVHRR